MGFLYISIIINLLGTISPHCLAASVPRHILKSGQAITGNQTLISPAGTFALGFFRPGNASSGRRNLYLGIWYNNIPEITVVWVANREQPIMDSATLLTVREDGNIALVDSKGCSLWSSNVSGITNGTVAMLLDSANLVLRQRNGVDVWQSFDHPTDTYLPGMKSFYDEKTSVGMRIVAWRNFDDPSPGDFSSGFSSLRFMGWRQNETYFASSMFVGNIDLWSLDNRGSGELQLGFQIQRVGSIIFVTYNNLDRSTPTRFTLEPSGDMKVMSWMKSQNYWQPFISVPSKLCEFYGPCGVWGACDGTVNPQTCRCLPGFVPENQTQWANNNFSGGCVRSATLLFTEGDNFLLVKNTKLPVGCTFIGMRSEHECKSQCRSSKKCTGYAFSNSTIVQGGDVCLIWQGDLTDLQMPNYGGENLYIRLAASELENIKKSGSILLPLLLSVGAAFSLGGFLCLFMRLRLRDKRRTRMTMMLEHIHFPGADSTDDEISDAPLVDLKIVKYATCDFSDANKLGEGGFGSVYKGNLANGQEIAVKRLSRGSNQGQLEFANEVKLIAKLQHKNLVRLLGWCNEKNEKILIYEYMPNNSLDKLIFGKLAELSWDQRFSIIDGIADGLLYLHHHSRTRIIHRDLKTSNILLDREMKPKISDFGLAKIMEINQTETSTRKVVGTLGYMSPEYAIDGVFSEKSDVFSFGVTVLEIMSGKRCAGYYPYKHSLNLLGYAWQLWNEGKALELLDPAAGSSTRDDKALKYVQVGLLCIEQHAVDRPTMNYVVSMLTNECCPLPLPKQPGFSFESSVRADLIGSRGSSGNGLTVSVMEAR